MNPNQFNYNQQCQQGSYNYGNHQNWNDYHRQQQYAPRQQYTEQNYKNAVDVDYIMQQADNFTLFSMNSQRQGVPQQQAYGPSQGYGSSSVRQSNAQDEINKLRKENEMLKEQLKLISTNINQFVHTILGIDIPVDVGILVTVDEGVIVAWNHIMWQKLGYNSNDLFNKIQTLHDLLDTTQSRHAFGALVEAVRNKRESYSVEFRMKRRNKQTIPARANTVITYDSITQYPIHSITFITFLEEQQQGIRQ